VNPAVVALLATAQGHQQSGNIEAAAATLERALSIDPQNASLWHQLADLRLRQAQFPQAAQLAAKSNLYATGNRTLQASNWRIIALAKEGAGDASGAREAYQRADALEAGQP
jgi:tetratricopeptide (TPR) repeat protein